jgi:integrase
VDAKNAKTFDECATAYIAAKRAGWSNPKHVDQWTNTLKTYASPVFGKLPVQAVSTELIVQALNPIWTTKTETATRVRQRIEAVLDWASVSGLRRGDNPARWSGHLEHRLIDPIKIKKVENLAALPFARIARFLLTLRKEQGIAPRAMEFMILTAARTGEVRGAVWDEIDLDERVWTVPAERMKMKREHRVPLCDQAVEILRAMEQHRTSEQPFAFPGGKAGQGLSDGAFLAVLKRMKRTDITPHGFRSSFRDWAAELTQYPNEVVEMALAHTIKNKSEAAYRRGDLFEKRRALMGDWARFCETVQPAKAAAAKERAVA